MEHDLTDRRRTGSDDLGQHSPPGQLEDTGTHQPVGREGVTAVAITVDEDHPDSRTGEQQRRRGAGDTTADHDDVAVAHAADTRAEAVRQPTR